MFWIGARPVLLGEIKFDIPSCWFLSHRAMIFWRIYKKKGKYEQNGAWEMQNSLEHMGYVKSKTERYLSESPRK